jgi:hypothetical protein
VGASESLTNVSVVGAVLPAASDPVTVSVGEVDVNAPHEKVFETYGPPAGVPTTDGVCVHPVELPTSTAVALDAGPEAPLSVSAFVSLSDPVTAPR